MEFLSGNRRIAYPLARHGGGRFDASRLLVDASIGCAREIDSVELSGAFPDAEGVSFEIVARAGSSEYSVTARCDLSGGGPYPCAFARSADVCAILVADGDAAREFMAGMEAIRPGIEFCSRCVSGGHRKVDSLELHSRACCDEAYVPPFKAK